MKNVTKDLKRVILFRTRIEGIKGTRSKSVASHGVCHTKTKKKSEKRTYHMNHEG